MTKRSSLIANLTAVGIIGVILAAILFSTSEAGYTCSLCGNDIYVVERLTWRGNSKIVKCVTDRPLTTACKHPPYIPVKPPAPLATRPQASN